MPPNGVSMRVPPANGFAGSAVWQLAQSPAIASALPRAMVSATGSVCARPAVDAVHKSTHARITRWAQCRPGTDLSPLGGIIARNHRGWVGAARFAREAPNDTIRKAG